MLFFNFLINVCQLFRIKRETKQNCNQNKGFQKFIKYKQTQSNQQQMLTTVPYEMAYMTKSTFHLGEDLSARKKKQQPLIPLQLETLVGKVQSFVDDINHKITNRIQLVQQVYLDDYKDQVFQMSNQLRNIRAMLDSQIIKQRANQKMFYLEEERDFFRSQVVKLNIQVNKLNQQNLNLKKKYQQEKSESENYRKIVYNLQAKLLKMRNLDIQAHNFDKNIMIKNSINQNKNSAMETVDSKTALTTTRYNKSSINNQEDQNQNLEKMAKTTGRLRPSQSMKSYHNKFTASSQVAPVLNSYQKTFFTKTKIERPQGYDQILQKQQIINECMNEVKKQIYYRNLSIKDKQSKTMHFNINQQVPFEKFTKTDKKQLIIKLLSHQRVLQEFYQFLFSKRRNQDQSVKLKTMRSKITDARFNTKMLTELKTQFNKKIFDIKHNQ